MNIIGDQLITDKKVAVIEVIKNCYDADAEKVQVRFFNIQNHGKSYLTDLERPYIEIEDDGDGMTLKTIKEIWLRPATPYKLDKKKQKNNYTAKGRIIQGEKGIGRFAIHKLGEKVEVYTKTETTDEIKLVLDFTEFDPEKADIFNQESSDYKLLKDVQNKWYVNAPPEEIKKPKGTLIRIFNLRETWKESDFMELEKAKNRLIPPIDPYAKEIQVSFARDFDVKLFIEGRERSSEGIISFDDVIERAQFRCSGIISHDGLLRLDYSATTTNRKIKGRQINLLSQESLAIYNYTSWAITNWFLKPKEERKPNCGKLNFSLYAYDLANRDKTLLTKDVETFVKENFVYVIRDGVRVYPFGEKGIDWLNLDKLRARVKAGQFPSYNDLFGFIYISQEQNPLLKDSTNRQGMMDIDGAYEDFVHLTTAVTEIFNTEIKIDKTKYEIQKSKSLKDSNAIVQNSFNALRKSLEKIEDVDVLQKANKFLQTVEKHNEVMKERMETVEDLAGLGMAVEKHLTMH